MSEEKLQPRPPEDLFGQHVIKVFSGLMKEVEGATGELPLYTTYNSKKKFEDPNRFVSFVLDGNDGVRRIIMVVYEAEKINRIVYVNGQAVIGKNGNERTKAGEFGALKAPIFNDGLHRALRRAFVAVTSWTNADLT